MSAFSTMAARPRFSTVLPTLRDAFIPASTSIKQRLDLFRHSRAFLSTSPNRLDSYKPLKNRIPSSSWDSHMHVVEPRYPVITDAAYEPTLHTIDDAIAFESSLGIKNVVLVQPSIYGFDNSCLLDSLRRIGPSRGRGVVVIDPANIQTNTLRAWHFLGVRGVRVNFRSSGKVPTSDELEQMLPEQARLIRPLGWMIQVHLPMSTIPLLEQIIPQLGVKVCIDHFGAPDLHKGKRGQRCSFDPYTLPGFSSLIDLLKAGRTYVKISAPYRLSRDEGFQDLEIMIREFLREAPNRVLYATDWPHTRFSGVDIEPFTERCVHICGSQALVERVFRLNAEELMDYTLDI
ncbi:hypothetical protein BDW62DRAFT_193771 [Aspergillus aurantiobrunneus]